MCAHIDLHVQAPPLKAALLSRQLSPQDNSSILFAFALLMAPSRINSQDVFSSSSFSSPSSSSSSSSSSRSSVSSVSSLWTILCMGVSVQSTHVGIYSDSSVQARSVFFGSTNSLIHHAQTPLLAQVGAAVRKKDCTRFSCYKLATNEANRPHCHMPRWTRTCWEQQAAVRGCILRGIVQPLLVQTRHYSAMLCLLV